MIEQSHARVKENLTNTSMSANAKEKVEKTREQTKWVSSFENSIDF